MGKDKKEKKREVHCASVHVPECPHCFQLHVGGDMDGLHFVD
jgi:hypothetical protein